MSMTQEQRVSALEAIVDSETLEDTLIALHIVALEKAEHITASYGDKATAKVWERAARAIRAAAENSSVITVSA